MVYRKGRAIRGRAACLALAAAAVFGSSGTAGARQAAGMPPRYAVELKALLNAGGVTDVSVRVIPASAAVVRPGVAKQILLKSYLPDGVTAFWAKSYLNVPLDAQGKARFSYTNLQRYQPLTAQVTIQTAQMVNAQVYRADSRVLDRPDLDVRSVSAPTQILINQPVTVQASIHERNGDVGATCDVVLKNAANAVLDSAVGIWVGPAGTTAVLLATQFSSPGTYALTVEIRNSNPTEFDAANDLNNSANVTILVVAGSVPTQYVASYDDDSFSVSDSERQFDFLRTTLRFASTFQETGESESFGYSSFFFTPLTSAGFSVDVLADGAGVISASIPVGSPTSTSSFDDGLGNSFTQINYFIPLNPDVTDLLLFSSQSGTGKFSTPFSIVQVTHFAFNVVFFSSQFDALFGCTFTSGGSSGGSFWRARSSIHTDVRVIASDGTQYGGRTDTFLSPSQSDVGPVTTVKADPGADIYMESTSEFHSRNWDGTSSGITY